MAKSQESYIFQGVQQDLSVSKHPAQFLYEGLNVRLTARDGNTMMSVTNEKGTEETNIVIDGEYVGHCLLNEYLVVFSTTGKFRDPSGKTFEEIGYIDDEITYNFPANDLITRIDLSSYNEETGEYEAVILYAGGGSTDAVGYIRSNLGFCINDSFDFESSYENENIQKIYWVDGFNQPRMINIAVADTDSISKYTPTSFDFVSELTLQEVININQLFVGDGEFPPGVLQYAFTYSRKYGQESNIFHTTPLHYITFKDRAGSPEEKINTAFKITVNGVDRRFDYLNIYSILRTSLNATPAVKRVAKIKLLEDVSEKTETEEAEVIEKVWSDKGTNVTWWFSTDKENWTQDLSQLSALRTSWLYKESSEVGGAEEGWSHISVCSFDNVPRSKNTYPAVSTFEVPEGYTKMVYLTQYDFRNLYVRLDVYEQTGYSDTPALAQYVYTCWEEDPEHPYDPNASHEFKAWVSLVGTNPYFLYVEDQPGSSESGMDPERRDLTEEKTIIYPRISNGVVTYIDTNRSGDSVDPSSLLYIGGEEITAKTICQKDGTLFLGNISIKRPFIPVDIKNAITKNTGATKVNPVSDRIIKIQDERHFLPCSRWPFYHINTLACPEEFEYRGALGFKCNEYYRLGVQFQHKTGLWSEPCWIGDAQQSAQYTYDLDAGTMNIPGFRYDMSKEICNQLLGLGYWRARAVFVKPEVQDRTRLCQGLACPTMYRQSDQGRNIDAISSWIFRPTEQNPSDSPDPSVLPFDKKDYDGGGARTGGGKIRNYYNGHLHSIFNNNLTDSPANINQYIESTEVWGFFNDIDKFKLRYDIFTINTPDAVHDDTFHSLDFNGYKLYHIANVEMRHNYGDIDINMATSPIGAKSPGFERRSGYTSGDAAFISGYFYRDFIVDDHPNDTSQPVYYTNYTPKKKIEGTNTWVIMTPNPGLWPVCMWHCNSPLNNDVWRSGNSAVMNWKKISNYRVGMDRENLTDANIPLNDIKLFSGEHSHIEKLGENTYLGNINMAVIPNPTSLLYNGNPYGNISDSAQWMYAAGFKMVIPSLDGVNPDEDGVYGWSDDNERWQRPAGNNPPSDDGTNPSYKDVGDRTKGLLFKKEVVPINYKSSPHIVAYCNSSSSDIYGMMFTHNGNYSHIPLVEIVKDYNRDVIFGGTKDNAFLNSTWIPCGPTVKLWDTGNSDEPETWTNNGGTSIPYLWGDTYFQQYEALKTYASSPSDLNQVVDVATFYCESRVNLDGRYDRNRAQKSNIDRNITNFNLINPVYSQPDNFFSYRMLDPKLYELSEFSNQITWTKEKHAAEDVDAWTNTTLAGTLDLNGSMGEVTALRTWKDQIFCFQNRGVSNILFNSRVQVPVSDGIPVEISNNYKVDGYKYLSNGVGCDYKELIQNTSVNLYFIDSITNHLFRASNDISDLSAQYNMTTWFRDNASSIKKLCYDGINHDLYIVQEEGHDSLCFSENLNQFTGLYSYDDIDLIEVYDDHVFTLKDSKLFRMFDGNYGDFFGKTEDVDNVSTYVPNIKPWGITFISNGISNSMLGTDKIFTNIEFRANVEDDGTIQNDKFIPSLPLTSLEVWNEYQHGYAMLRNQTGHSAMLHHTNDDYSSLKRKYRIWRCDIPRNNCEFEDVEHEWDKPYSKDTELPNCFRKIRKPIDRMRNPWLYIKLGQEAADVKGKVELHDILVTYFN